MQLKGVVMSKALSVDNILNYKPEVMDFQGAWESSFGQPEKQGTWIIWGNSGNGKTRFALQLARYLCEYSRVLYVSLEEGLSVSFQRAIQAVGMKNVARKFVMLDRVDLNELIDKLKKRKSPRVVIIDSIQYLGINYLQYKKLKKIFPHKVFIFISHAEGKEPAGRTAKSVRYDSDVKCRVEGYKAFPVTRFGGGEPYVIWQEGARKYYLENS